MYLQLWPDNHAIWCGATRVRRVLDGTITPKLHVLRLNDLAKPKVNDSRII